ncbi:MAG: phenylalanine 4-monooxygenase [Bernardetiaceae bacterium]
MLKQDYERYSAEDFEVWKLLYQRQAKVLPGRAAREFLEGIQKIDFVAERIPYFPEMNERLSAITGWNVVVVPGLIDNKSFFEYLRDAKFPASTWLRRREELDYLEEPDMFHDVYGHVPILTNQPFCDFLSGLSEIALKHIDNEWAVEMLSRVYWYTVEFGLIQQGDRLEIYGAGILSSAGESVYSLESDIPARVPYDVRQLLATPYIKDKFQETYFVIQSYEQLYQSLPLIEAELERALALEKA